MKIDNTMSLPAGMKYYEVSEEIWFMTGEDGADRDFINHEAFETLPEAVLAVLKSDTRNRLYIDLMEKNPNGNKSAHGLPVWAGYKSQMVKGVPYDAESGWRFTNFDAMGEAAPSNPKVAA